MGLPEIQVLFEKSLEIPSVKPTPQFFLCPVGLVGAGKTTVMRPLTKELGLVRISTDELRRLLKEHRFGWDEAEEIALAVGGKFAREGYSIGIDADCIRAEKRAKIEKHAKELGARVLYVHIAPPEEFIINKLMSFEHSWLFRDGAHAVENYRLRKPLHENLGGIPFTYTFDTSRDDLSKQIEEAVQRIREELQK